MNNRSTRRRFIQSSAAFGVFVATRSFAAQPASPAEKLNLAVIGPGGRGRDNLKGVSSQNVVALCDVDEKTLARPASEHPKARLYHDWRKLFDEMGKSIDGVVISTPDHQHAGPTLAALQLGKHVYCEKPLAHTVAEVRKVAEAARRAGPRVATQMGTQIHAEENYRRVVELIRAGAIGKVSRIHVWVPGGPHGGDRPAETPPVPRTLHWDLWLGPAPERPYSPAYHPFRWRGWWDFGGGQLSDMACHHVDLSHWALGLRTPERVETEGPEPHPDCPPKWLIAHYHYPAADGRGPVHLTWYHGDKRPPQVLDKTVKGYGAGTIFEGEKGLLVADYGKHHLLPEPDFKDYERPEKSIPRSIGHHNEWIEACKTGSPTTCNFDYAAALTEAVLLGNVAHRAGNAKIEYDPKSGRIPNLPAAERWLTKGYRKGWEV